MREARTRWLVVAMVAALLGGMLLPAGTRVSPVLGAFAGKKVCKTVKKHGKKVKVCHTVKPKPTATPRTGAALATTLASRIAARGTRSTALLDLMRALHVGVRTPAGVALVHGAERNGNDFFLYDMQLKAISNAMDRNERWTLGDLAARFNLIGNLPGDTPLDPEILRSVLRDGVRSAEASPTDPLSLVPLVVRDLGLKHDPAFDLAADPPAATVSFDAVQAFLIEADVLVPLIAREAPPAAHGALQLSRHLLPAAFHVAAPTHAGPCDVTEGTKSAWAFGKWLAGLGAAHWLTKDKLAMLKAWGAHIGTAAAAMEVVQIEWLTVGIKVTSATPDTVVTHEGPAGHAADAGKPFKVATTVTMKDDYGETIISCGSMVGLKVPPPGPVKGVNIDWTSQDLTGVGPMGQVTQSLKAYGTTSVDPADGQTGADGTSTFTFTPKDETFPGFGEVQTAEGTVIGTAHYLSSFGNVPGYGVEMFIRKEAQRKWAVLYHRPRGFKFGPVSIHYSLTPPPSGSGGVGGGCRLGEPGCHGSYTLEEIDQVYTGTVCGPDPYRSWHISLTTTTRNTYQDGYVETSTSQSPGVWNFTTPDQLSEANWQYEGNWARIVMQPVPQIHVHIQSYGVFKPSQTDFHPPIEDNPTCG